MSKQFKVILPALIILFGSFLFINKLQSLGSTYDENFSYISNSKYLVKNFRWDQPFINLHPPLMYYLHGWIFALIQSPNTFEDLFIARLAAFPVFLFFGLLIYWFVNNIAGPENALVSLILYFCNIEILAHSRLATADFILSVTATLTLMAFYYFIKKMSWKNTTFLGVSLALTLLSKYSALIIILSIFLIFIFFILQKKINLKNLYFLMVAMLIAVVVLHSGYLFKESGKIPTDFKNSSLISLEANAITRPLLFILPNAYLKGMDIQLTTSQSVWWGYFNGTQYLSGLWYFYIAAFLLKTQIPLLILLVLTVFILAKKKKLDDLDLILSVTSLTLIFYFSFFNKLIIGLRYLLPIYPILIILISKNLHFSPKTKSFNLFMIVLLIIYMIQPLGTSGHFIEYTNEITGGSKNAYKYFADSNLDWNQNQSDFEKYYAIHPEIAAVNPRKPTSGIVAINVNEMNLYYYQNYLWLRKLNKKPIDNVGFTWLIFDINPSEINQ